MHIADGVLSRPVWIGGATAAAAGIAVGLKKMEDEEIPRVAVLASAFFVASLIHVPVGVSSAHLLLNGLTGLILGWEAFPALFVALLLQYLIFSFGGLTTLGINTLDMALPAVVCGALFSGPIRRGGRGRTLLFGFLAGAGGVLLAGLMAATALCLSGKEWIRTAKMLLAAHVPVMIAEGVITAAVVGFLKRVRPEMLERGNANAGKKRQARPPTAAEAAGGSAAAAVPCRRVFGSGRAFRTGAARGCALLAALAAGTAGAHKVHIFAVGEGDAITGYAYFSGGVRARNCPIQVFGPGDKKVCELRTDRKGEFHIPVSFRCAYRLVLDTGDGHRAHTVVPADELDPALPPPGPGESPRSAAGSVPPESRPAESAAAGSPPSGGLGVAPKTLERIVDRVVARRLRPIEERLDANEEKIRWHDVLGGIGYILGFAGLWALLRARGAT